LVVSLEQYICVVLLLFYLSTKQNAIVQKSCKQMNTTKCHHVNMAYLPYQVILSFSIWL